ncbi:sulfatase-like hydrolase/transferase [Bradyrhizobium canariense]|uniref:sulfatase-like hydrolase/transferase n=1 Tax=Bradyrhizobium canariense TaxID=255045 RepID=UPI00142FCD34|nr:sulfatase-like hydrolase/transferase [Bradyrhizobium canariense]
MRRIFEICLSVVVLGLFSGVAFLNFYRINFESLEGASRTLRWYFMVLATAIVISLAAKAVFRSFPIARIFLVAAVISFMAFSYDEIKMLVSHDEIKTLVGDDNFLKFSVGCWAVATLLIGVLVGIFSRQAVVLPTMALVGIIYVVPAAMSLVQARAHPVTVNDPKALALTARRTPNVYWIVLDGYPRQDVLQEFFNFDNEPFVQSLKGLDFTVYDHALASFPETIFSISSTVSLGFLVSGTGSSLKMPPSAELYRAVRGQNVVVNTMRSMGYRYIHFENGYDNLTQCPMEGAICIKGNVQSDGGVIQFDEFNLAVLSKTPLMDLIAAFANRSADQSPFMKGAVHELTNKLSSVPEHGEPFFLYAHVLAPHPPIRFRRDCSVRVVTPDLVDWNSKDRSAFLDQLGCVNDEAIALLKTVVQRDPQAIIVVQSDHGTAFRGQFKKPFDAWDQLDLKERFGALNALRMPAACSSYAQGTVDLVNTFSRVLSCISDRSLPDKVSRQFVVWHGDMTSVHEYRMDSE